MKKLLIFLAVLFTALIPLTVNAEEIASDGEYTPVEVDIEYRIEFTYDSASKDKCSAHLELYEDKLLNDYGVEIVLDLPIGVKVYDIADTEYIDGIRVNDEKVNSFRISLKNNEVDTLYIIIKTDYEDSFLGSIAQIDDGTFDWSKVLFSLPGILVQLFVYIRVGLTLYDIGKRIINRFKKNGKAVVEKISDEDFRKELASEIAGMVIPLAEGVRDNNTSVLKALAVQASGGKTGEILDILKDSTLGVDESLVKAKEAVEQAEKMKAEQKKKLKDIITANNQEVKRNEGTPIF